MTDYVPWKDPELTSTSEAIKNILVLGTLVSLGSLVTCSLRSCLQMQHAS